MKINKYWCKIAFIVMAMSGTLFSSMVFAHAFPPSLLVLEEKGMEEEGNGIALYWKTGLKSNGFPMSPVLPEGCQFRRQPTLTTDTISAKLNGTLVCTESGLAGKTISITNIKKNQTPVIFRYKREGKENISGLLNADAPTLKIPTEDAVRQATNVVTGYLKHGFIHLLLGYDHVLFVIALVLLVARSSKLVQAVTCFTVGHSASLALSAMGFITINTEVVEVLIAASIAMMAAEIIAKMNTQRESTSSDVTPLNNGVNILSYFERHVWLLATSFGLLHGLGFASALADLQLPTTDLVVALISFNVGIEFGQLLIIAGCFLVNLLITQMNLRKLSLIIMAPRYIAYGVGYLATFWVLERTQIMM